MRDRVNVGVIGCGDVSDIYFKNLAGERDSVCLTACANRHIEAARAAAEKHHIPRVMTIDELLADPSIDLVLDLTAPAAHDTINRRALLAGKHVYSEKPLGATPEQARELLHIARERGLRIGCAPDTFLGGGLQTCRQLLDQGEIGRPLAACAFLAWHGPEREHPNPAFLYQPGAGPMLDYGPYYMTALIHLLGPARAVCAMAAKGFDTRTCTCPGPHAGELFSVGTPTHVTGTIRFQNGVLATVLHSFDVWGHGLPFLEIYGTEGTLRVPDPDTFGGPVCLLRARESVFREVPLTYGHTENCRGIGLVDMAEAIREGRPHRASGELALHALEIMHAFLTSAGKERFVTLETACRRPARL